MAPGMQHIVLGDFNLHHPLWSGTQYRHVDDEAAELIDLVDEHGLEQLLPPGTVTYERADARTTIDLIWASSTLTDRLVSCTDKREWWYGADHVPILTQFDLAPVKVPPIVRRDWGSSDWELFLKLMDTYDWHPRELADRDEIDNAVAYLIDAIDKTAEQATPTKQITPYSRAVYTPEMADLKHHVSRCRKHARRTDSAEVWKEYKEAKKELKKRTNELARDLHRHRIEEATESLSGFWKVARWAHQVAERWERTHASKFAPAKYQLAHFWRKHQSVPKPRSRLDVPLTIKGIEVKPKDSIKYLGVLLDTHLTGEAHVRQMRKKAAKLVAGLSSIAGSTWGTPLLHLRKIYTAVLQPQIMYACSTWYICGGRGFVGAQRATEQAIQSIQSQALHRISGAFRRTSRQALEVCLHVPPSELTLARLAEEACLRLMTSPLRSTLHSTRSHAHRNDPFTSPLHRLETTIDRKLGRGVCRRIETIHPFVVPPWWEPPDMQIDDTREEAIHTQTTTTGIQLFTDGSGFDGGIGAAAYSPILGYAARPIGSSDTHTVYAGELEGIDAALGLLIRNQQHSGIREATIYTDNQAAIRATCHPQRSSGQYILRRIVRQLELLRDARSRWRVRLQWVPGHEGVPGNEEADRLTKLAATEATQRTRENGQIARINAPNQSTPHAARVSFNPYHSMILVAVCRQRLRAGFADQWKEQWDGAEHGRHLYRIVQTPAKKVLTLHEGLKRAWSSVLIQLQTGKSALRSFLASVQIEDSPLCQCGLGNQNTAHVLVRCPLHTDLRMETLYKEARETDDRRLLSEPQWVRRSIEFVLRTGLLTQFRNTIPLVWRSQ
ncbi:hypothetical protein ZTR_10067 [Talaromyces verruculosus]|nr:hypothetical protein ZTR_10067 [Talaromyces verruculosus]